MKADTKSYFGHNRCPFCSGFFILTTNFPKNGYLSKNNNSLYIHFFEKKIEIIVEKKLQENIPEVIVVPWTSLHNIEGFSREGESPGKKIVFLITAETSTSLEGCFKFSILRPSKCQYASPSKPALDFLLIVTWLQFRIPYTHTLVSWRINSRSSDSGLWVPYVDLPTHHSSANPTPASGDVLRDRKAFSLSPLLYQIHTCTTVLISQIMSGREARQEQRPW